MRENRYCVWATPTRNRHTRTLVGHFYSTEKNKVHDMRKFIRALNKDEKNSYERFIISKSVNIKMNENGNYQ